MNISLSNIVSASEIQRNYRKVFNRAKKSRNPIIVFRGDEPEVAIMDIKTLQEKENRLEELEIENTLRMAAEGRREFKEGKTIKTKSLADFLND